MMVKINDENRSDIAAAIKRQQTIIAALEETLAASEKAVLTSSGRTKSNIQETIHNTKRKIVDAQAAISLLKSGQHRGFIDEERYAKLIRLDPYTLTALREVVDARVLASFIRPGL